MLTRDRLGEFAVKPQQTEVRAVFAPLRRLQRDLAVPGQVNTILVSGGERTDARLRSALELEDLGVRVSTVESPRAVVLESANGIVSEALETAARTAVGKLGLQPVPVFTYLANTIRKGDRHVPYSLLTATDLSLLPPAASAAAAPRASPAAWEPKRLSSTSGLRASSPRRRAIASTSTTTSGTRRPGSSRAVPRSR